METTNLIFMKITEITSSFGQTIQLAPYEPINLHASVKAEVGEGEDLKEAYSKCFSIVRDEVNSRIEIVKKKIRTQKLKDLETDSIS